MSNSYDVTSRISTAERRALALCALCEAGNVGDRKALAEAQIELAEAAAADDVAHGRVTVATVLETVRVLLLQVVALGAFFEAKGTDQTVESKTAFMLRLMLNAALAYAEKLADPAYASHIFGGSEWCSMATKREDEAISSLPGRGSPEARAFYGAMARRADAGELPFEDPATRAQALIFMLQDAIAVLGERGADGASFESVAAFSASQDAARDAARATNFVRHLWRAAEIAQSVEASAIETPADRRRVVLEGLDWLLDRYRATVAELPEANEAEIRTVVFGELAGWLEARRPGLGGRLRGHTDTLAHAFTLMLSGGKRGAPKGHTGPKSKASPERSTHGAIAALCTSLGIPTSAEDVKKATQAKTKNK